MMRVMGHMKMMDHEIDKDNAHKNDGDNGLSVCICACACLMLTDRQTYSNLIRIDSNQFQ